MKLSVVGLGKIGLPFAVRAAESGCTVLGADISPEVVAVIAGGAAPFPNEAGLDERLAAAVSSGRLVATTDTTAAAESSEVVVVIVPLVVDRAGRPDFTALDAATAAVGAGIKSGALVSYETTVPVGTTRTRFTPMLAQASGLVPGSNLFVSYSPERVFSGRVFADLSRYPKLVGGIDEASAQRAADFYRYVLDFDDRTDLPKHNGVWDLGSAEAAELAKLVETTYRDVNIALANEFARYAATAGVDIDVVISAANSQPFSHVHRPGIAVGGHCIPVYPRFYLAGDPAARLPAVAREVNEAMPAHAVDLLADLVGPLRGLTVVVLGAAYRGGVKETAFSGVFAVVHELADRGATALVDDPLFSREEVLALGLEPYERGTAVDAAILQADHAEYMSWSPADLPGVRALVDGRSVLDHARWAGVPITRIGAPQPK